jgi:hypothetical protein
MWNTIRNVDTLSKFKEELKKIDEAENNYILYIIKKLKFSSLPSHR